MTLPNQSPNNQTEIIMKTDMNDLRDIYFGKREHIYFFGPKTKVESFVLVGAVILCPLILLCAINTKAGGIAFFVSVCGFFAAIGTFWSATKPIIDWKKAINTFLATAEKVKTLKIIYDDESILHIQDGEQFKLNWTAVKYAIINDRSVSICSDITNILLPKSSMTAEEYTVLCDKIMEKVQEVQKT